MALEAEGRQLELRPPERLTQKGHDAKLTCSIGVMAYNEQANIAAALDSILSQRLANGHITEVIVVASGCSDRTCVIVADIARHDPRVHLIEQQRREGKA